MNMPLEKETTRKTRKAPIKSDAKLFKEVKETNKLLKGIIVLLDNIWNERRP